MRMLARLRGQRGGDGAHSEHTGGGIGVVAIVREHP